jgi:predicted dehydrogenase
MSQFKQLSRRGFLKATAAVSAAIAAPTIIPSSALGADGAVAPSNRITLSFIGIGNQGGGHLGNMINTRDVQILAVCDARETVRQKSRERVEKGYAGQNDRAGYKGCGMYTDFREMLARKDIDAVLIATPEHWHALCVIEAAKAGKDIYCEKPLSHTIHEARTMVNAVRRYGRVFQTGSQQRSSPEFRQACEYVQSGRIGKLQSVHVSVGGTSHEVYLPEEPVEPGLDWDLWQGPALWAPYNKERASGSYSGGWRLIRDYSGGMMCDWGAHHFDIAQWGLGMDHSGPVEIYPPGKEYPVLTYKYANGVPVHHMFGDGAGKIKVPTPNNRVNGVLFVGDKGWVEVNRGYLKTFPDDIMRTPLAAGEVHLYRSKDHHTDWLDAIRNRTRPICDIEIGARTITVCHLGNIAYWTGRPLKWDPVKEQITNDPEANRMLSMPMRAPWVLS